LFSQARNSEALAKWQESHSLLEQVDDVDEIEYRLLFVLQSIHMTSLNLVQLHNAKQAVFLFVDTFSDNCTHFVSRSLTTE